MMQFEAGNDQAKKHGARRGDGQRRAYAKPQLVCMNTENTQSGVGPFVEGGTLSDAFRTTAPS
jgi:hypothetical protein